MLRNLDALWIPLVLLLSYSFGKVNYTGHSVVRLNVYTPDTFVYLLDQLEINQFDIWAVHSSSLLIDVHVNSSALFDRFLQDFNTAAFNHSVWISDIQELIDEVDSTRPCKSCSADSFFDDYQRYDAFIEYAKLMAQQYLEVEFVESIGKTEQGVDIFALRIGGQVSNSTNSDKVGRAVYIQGGIHAREWIAPSTVMYIAEQLAGSGDGTVRDLVSNLEFVIVPLLNVDGYEYSQTNDRMWRKNRKTNSGSSCMGVDLNRNWGDHWGGGGSSSNPCSDTYRGTKEFSESESAAVVDYLKKIENTITGGIDFHSYGQLILRPYGWQTPDRGKPANDDFLNQVGKDMQTAISATSRMSYTNEHAAELYVAAGGADDWFYSGLTGNRMGFTIELRDTGRYGFILPASQIVPTGEEAMAAIIKFGEAALKIS